MSSVTRTNFFPDLAKQLCNMIDMGEPFSKLRHFYYTEMIFLSEIMSHGDKEDPSLHNVVPGMDHMEKAHGFFRNKPDPKTIFESLFLGPYTKPEMQKVILENGKKKWIKKLHWQIPEGSHEKFFQEWKTHIQNTLRSDKTPYEKVGELLEMFKKFRNNYPAMPYNQKSLRKAMSNILLKLEMDLQLNNEGPWFQELPLVSILKKKGIESPMLDTIVKDHWFRQNAEDRQRSSAISSSEWAALHPFMKKGMHPVAQKSMYTNFTKYTDRKNNRNSKNFENKGIEQKSGFKEYFKKELESGKNLDPENWTTSNPDINHRLMLRYVFQCQGKESFCPELVKHLLEWDGPPPEEKLRNDYMHLKTEIFHALQDGMMAYLKTTAPEDMAACPLRILRTEQRKSIVEKPSNILAGVWKEIPEWASLLEPDQKEKIMETWIQMTDLLQIDPQEHPKLLDRALVGKTPQRKQNNEIDLPKIDEYLGAI